MHDLILVQDETESETFPSQLQEVKPDYTLIRWSRLKTSDTQIVITINHTEDLFGDSRTYWLLVLARVNTS